MIGENFKRLNRNSDAKKLQDKIYELKYECGKIYTECRNTGHFDHVKHDDLSKQIEKLEYHLWGTRNGMRLT